METERNFKWKSELEALLRMKSKEEENILCQAVYKVGKQWPKYFNALKLYFHPKFYSFIL